MTLEFAKLSSVSELRISNCLFLKTSLDTCVVAHVQDTLSMYVPRRELFC